MGSCMSCKAGKEPYGYTTAPAIYHTSQTHYFRDMDNTLTPTIQSEAKGTTKRGTPYTRGQATLFGFKRRPTSGIPTPVSCRTSSPIQDNVTTSQESLNNISPIASGRSTPRPNRQRKDVNRFGFRSQVVTNKVADSSSNVVEPEKPRSKGGGKIATPVGSMTSLSGSSEGTRPRQQRSFIPQPEFHPEPGKATRFTLQTSLLPRPQYPIRLSSVEADTKTAKTAANNSTRKVTHHQSSPVDESSSKEGSLNGDSGISSHQSTAACYGETDTLQGIEQLDSSPTFGARRNRNMHKPRTLEMVVNGKYFDVRDLKDEDSSAADDPNVITEISLISLPKTSSSAGPSRSRVHKPLQYRPQYLQDNKSNDEGLGGEEEEEKVFRDRTHSEKTESIKDMITPGSMEEDWGPGEAMAEEYSSSSEDVTGVLRRSSSPDSLNTNIFVPETILPTVTMPQKPRPVELTIEDPLFAAIAAAASPTMIEDETSPVDSLLSSSTNSTSTSATSEDMEKVLEEKREETEVQEGEEEEGEIQEKEEEPQEKEEGVQKYSSSTMLSPVSPGTPTNASTSLSLSVSEGRDFLIDDEIADQPALTFGDVDPGTTTTAPSEMATSSGGCTSQLLSMTENTPSATLVEPVSKQAAKRPTAATTTTSVDGSPARTRHLSRTGSIDTLSPCESIASDDLMLDYERSEGSAFDCTAEGGRLDNSSGALHQLNEETLMSELEAQSHDVMKEWSSLLGNQGLVSNISSPRILRSRTGNSTPDSPRSLDSKTRIATSSPLRPPRQSTPSSETDDGSLKLDRGTYQHMYQDIVNIKTMLLKLKRVLQEAETLNPFDGSLKNGLFYTLASSEAVASSGDGDHDSETSMGQSLQEEAADLRRQVVFLQQQLEDKERTIQLLQLQMTKYTESATNGASAHGNSTSASKELCNAATQTERMRPVSAGPSLLQSLPSENSMGPLVSSTDTWSQRKRLTVGERQQPALTGSKLPITRVWKQPRSSTPSPDLVAMSSGIPTRKYTAATSASTLPRRSKT